MRNTRSNPKETSPLVRAEGNRSVAHAVGQLQHRSPATLTISDNRRNSIMQRVLQPSLNTNRSVYQLGKKRKRQNDDNDRVPIKKRRVEKDYYLDKHYNFQLGDDSEDEIYNQHIDDLIDGLDIDRSELELYLQKDRQKIMRYKRKDVRKMIAAKKRNITEKVGELNASQFMKKNYPSAKLIYGFGKGIGFDQVYQKGDKIIIVEAKGPGAKLGSSARKGKQMSKNWVMMTAKGMSNTKVRKKIYKANKMKKLRGLVITSTAKGNAPRKGLYYDYNKN
jgi:hypothetical protein